MKKNILLFEKDVLNGNSLRNAFYLHNINIDFICDLKNFSQLFLKKNFETIIFDPTSFQKTIIEEVIAYLKNNQEINFVLISDKDSIKKTDYFVLKKMSNSEFFKPLDYIKIIQKIC